MRLLYLDASGDPGWYPPDGRSPFQWYVIGGLVLEEGSWKGANDATTSLLGKYFGRTLPSARELRRTTLIAAAPPYDRLTPTKRWQLDGDVFALIKSLNPVLFAAAVDKVAHRAKYAHAIAPHIWGLQLVAPRFHKFLGRVDDHGMMVMDQEEARKDRKMMKLISDAKSRGIILQSGIAPDPFRTNSRLSRLVENVMFLRSEDSPLVQLADFCSHAIWSHFERGVSTRFNEIYPLFDKVGSNVYGLKVWSPR